MHRTTRNRFVAGLVLALGFGGVWLHRAQGAAPASRAAPPPPVPSPLVVRAARVARVARATDSKAALPSLRALPPPTVPPLLNEAALMTELRRVKDGDPEQALALARNGNQRFADSPDAPERTAIIIYALTALGRPSEGRGEAETMVNHYPDSKWVREIEQYTGAHRHRNIRTNAEGQLEYY